MAWRETSSSWSRFMFLFLCIAFGVGAIVAIDLFAASVERIIFGDARALSGGDIEISWRRALTEKSQDILHSLSKRQVTLSHVTELAAMANTELTTSPTLGSLPTSQLVELKAIDSFYPLYGRIITDPLQTLVSQLAENPPKCQHFPCFGTLVQESFLIRLNLSIGSEVRIGQAYFLITGILQKEPDRVATAFSLGPRLLISQKALQATQLVQTGSRIRERYRLKLPDGENLEAWLGELRGRLSPEGAKVTSFREAQPRLRRFLDQLTLYLGLIGLTILMVGGIGVACTIQGFVSQKIPIIATIKTLGADSPQMMRIYLTQSLVLGGIGSLLGACLGVGLHQLLPGFLEGIIPLHYSMTPTFTPILRGILLGILATMAFSLWPLLAIRDVSPALVYRQEIEQSTSVDQKVSWVQTWKQSVRNWWADRIRVWVSLIIMVCITGLAIWQARSFSLGFFFTGAFLLAVLILLGTSNVLFSLVRHLRVPQRFLLRHTLNNLQRPGNFTKAMTLAIGIGVMLLITLMTIQRSLLDLLGNQIPENAPSFFFIDIQPDQYTPFSTLLTQRLNPENFSLVPVVRSRLLAINQKPIDPEEHKGKRNGWYFTREYVMTTSQTLPPDNEVTQGNWWETIESFPSTVPPQNENLIPFVSVEEKAAEHLDLDIGSTVTFDIQGVPFVTQVRNFRKVDWSSFSMNFFMILEPSSLDGAPLTYIATAKVPASLEIPLQQALVQSLPNVTAINVGDVLDNIRTIFQQLAKAIHALAGLCLITGAVVMVAAISINRFRRIREMAILKALGGSRGMLLFSLGMEFGLIGAIAALVGLGLGCVLSWSILYFFFDLPWDGNVSFMMIGFITTVVLTLLTGFLGTFRLLGSPPLAVLRQE